MKTCKEAPIKIRLSVYEDILRPHPGIEPQYIVLFLSTAAPCGTIFGKYGEFQASQVQIRSEATSLHIDDEIVEKAGSKPVKTSLEQDQLSFL